jgi:hypothetical protein
MVSIVSARIREAAASIEPEDSNADAGLLLHGTGDFLQLQEARTTGHAKFDDRDMLDGLTFGLICSSKYSDQVMGARYSIPMCSCPDIDRQIANNRFRQEPKGWFLQDSVHETWFTQDIS